MSQTESFRTQAPAPLAPQPIIIPTARETVLSNGLNVVVVEDSRLPLVSYRLALRIGSSYDPPKLPGLTDLAWRDYFPKEPHQKPAGKLQTKLRVSEQVSRPVPIQITQSLPRQLSRDLTSRFWSCWLKLFCSLRS